MSQYILGLLTMPALALIVAALTFLGVRLTFWARDWWLSPTDFDKGDWDHRARHASSVVAARRVWAFKLPGSRLLVYRSTVGGSDTRRYYDETARIEQRARAVLLDEFDPQG